MISISPAELSFQPHGSSSPWLGLTLGPGKALFCFSLTMSSTCSCDLQRWLWWEQATFSDWKVKSPSGSSDLERTHDLSFDSLFVALGAY